MYEKYKENENDKPNMENALESCNKSLEYYEKISHYFG